MRKLWYDKEAAVWEEALPVGNGRIGGMVYSGALHDRIQINEETLWSGFPYNKNLNHSAQKLEEIRKLIDERKYNEANSLVEENMFGEFSQAYVSFGNLFIDINNVTSKVENYKRELDLENAVVKTTYKIGDIEYKKEVFVSHPDDVLVMKITSNDKWLNVSAYTNCDLINNVTSEADTLIINGKCPTNVDSHNVAPAPILYEDDKESIQFQSKIKAISDGKVYSTGGTLRVVNASYVIFIVSLSTSFNGFDKMPVSQGADYKKICNEKLINVSKLSFEELMQRHISDYKSLFNRVELDLGVSENESLPTDIRIEKIKQGEVDNSLVSLLFDFGRYLLIASSRNGGQAANLQGIWNKEVLPPWLSNYTLNINAQMNYWGAEVCNLPECHMPFIQLVEDLSEKGNHYGLKGWCASHNSDIWRFNIEATKSACSGYWHMGGAWACRHIWEHYQYTNDKEFLKDKFPIIQGALDFLKNWLVQDKDGYLTVSPSTSPENSYLFNAERVAVCGGSAMDLTIVREIFTYSIEICDILGYDKAEYENILSKLKPLQIGKDGRLLEWNEEFEENEKGHRHISHLYGIYPSNVIMEGDKYFEACKKTLAYRLSNGGGHTGWSNAWIVNVFARFKDGEKAYEFVNNMFKKSIYPNMFDAHPPFQIDGNFGICAGITEMLMQSLDGKIKLLPAIPKAWKNGKVSGLKARGGYTVDFEWEEGKVANYKILGKDGTVCNEKGIICID